jgi:hypothetical protein
MNITRAEGLPFNSLKTARLSQSARQREHSPASRMSDVKRACFSTGEIFRLRVAIGIGELCNDFYFSDDIAVKFRQVFSRNPILLMN